MFPRGSDLHTRTQFQIHLLNMNDTIPSLCEQLVSEIVEASLDCVMRSSLDCFPAKRGNSCNPPTSAAPTNTNTKVDSFQPLPLNSSLTDAELGQEGRTKPQFRAKRPASSMLPNPNSKVSCNGREKRESLLTVHPGGKGWVWACEHQRDGGAFEVEFFLYVLLSIWFAVCNAENERIDCLRP